MSDGYYTQLQTQLARQKAVAQNAPLATAKELNQLIDRRNREKNTTFREILEMCMKRVKKCAYNRQYRCVFEVPEFMLGCPLYDVNDAIQFVINALKEECGMHVRYFFPRLLYISWHFDEIEGRVVMMPLMAEPTEAAHPEQHIALPPPPSRGIVDDPAARASFRAPPPLNPYLSGGGFLPPPSLSRHAVPASDGGHGRQGDSSAHRNGSSDIKTILTDPGHAPMFPQAGGGGGRRGGGGGRRGRGGRRGGGARGGGGATRSINEFKPNGKFVMNI